MELSRTLRHLVLPHWWVMRAFPQPVLGAVERAITASETLHAGELRFAVEANLPLPALWRGQSPRERAIELFSGLRVWDTRDNSGVLVYLQLIDRRVEIVADRGIDARVGQEFWDGVCSRLEAACRAGRFEHGTLAALDEITAALTRHFPAAATNPNELDDAAVVL